jgi:hypothetical protein
LRPSVSVPSRSVAALPRISSPGRFVIEDRRGAKAEIVQTWRRVHAARTT